MGLVIALTATLDKIAKSVILDFNLLISDKFTFILSTDYI